MIFRSQGTRSEDASCILGYMRAFVQYIEVNFGIILTIRPFEFRDLPLRRAAYRYSLSGVTVDTRYAVSLIILPLPFDGKSAFY